MLTQNLLAVVYVLMLLFQIVAEPSEGLSFSCFNHKSKEECHGNPTLSKYCLWSDSEASCGLSPFSLIMLCEFDHQPTICAQARTTCSQVTENDLCVLQSDVCDWDATTSTCFALPAMGEDVENKPPTQPTQAPTEEDDQYHRPCCSHGRRVCNGHGRSRSKKGFMRAAKAKCGVSRSSSKKALCAKWRKICT